MTETKTRPDPPALPAPMVKKLQRLREAEDRTSFYDHIASLRVNSWTLKSIAEALDVSRSSVSIWESKSVKDPEDLPETVQLPSDIDSSIKPIYARFDLTEDQSAELYVLTKTAAKVRRYTKDNDPAREAARKLEDLLHMYKDQGASLNALKIACGVSRRAVAQRLEKRTKKAAEKD